MNITISENKRYFKKNNKNFFILQTLVGVLLQILI